MFHPPSAGALVSARREVRVDQSIACTSTSIPMSRRTCAVTSEAVLRTGMSVGCMRMIFSPL